MKCYFLLLLYWGRFDLAWLGACILLVNLLLRFRLVERAEETAVSPLDSSTWRLDVVVTVFTNADDLPNLIPTLGLWILNSDLLS